MTDRQAHQHFHIPEAVRSAQPPTAGRCDGQARKARCTGPCHRNPRCIESQPILPESIRTRGCAFGCALP
eukprot:8712055-Alexandrium_andersonii.AAC.1